MSYRETDAYKAATRFWNLLDRPEEHNAPDTAKRWSLIMSDLMGEAQFELEEFNDLLRWALKTDPWTSEYLFLARDPAETLKKNFPNVLKKYKAFQRALNAKADREAKLSRNKRTKEIVQIEDKLKQVEV